MFPKIAAQTGYCRWEGLCSRNIDSCASLVLMQKRAMRVVHSVLTAGNISIHQLQQYLTAENALVFVCVCVYVRDLAGLLCVHGMKDGVVYAHNDLRYVLPFLCSEYTTASRKGHYPYATQKTPADISPCITQLPINNIWRRNIAATTNIFIVLSTHVLLYRPTGSLPAKSTTGILHYHTHMNVCAHVHIQLLQYLTPSLPKHQARLYPILLLTSPTIFFPAGQPSPRPLPPTHRLYRLANTVLYCRSKWKRKLNCPLGCSCSRSPWFSYCLFCCCFFSAPSLCLPHFRVQLYPALLEQGAADHALRHLQLRFLMLSKKKVNKTSQVQKGGMMHHTIAKCFEHNTYRKATKQVIDAIIVSTDRRRGRPAVTNDACCPQRTG